MDSGVIHRGRLYAAHSNDDESPKESSVEIFDASSMRHLGTHSFGMEHDDDWRVNRPGSFVP